MPGMSECLFSFFVFFVFNYKFILIYIKTIIKKTVALVFVPDSFENTSQISKAATGR